MRKRIALVLVVKLAVIAVVWSAPMAQTGTTTTSTVGYSHGTNPSNPGGTGTTTTTTTKTTKHAAAHHSVKGTVASVNSTAKSFVVHLAKGADITVKVNDKTKYTPKSKGWDDVSTDAKVTVSYRNNGSDNWALTVHFGPQPKANTTPSAKTGAG